jgi:hypothetical protein
MAATGTIDMSRNLRNFGDNLREFVRYPTFWRSPVRRFALDCCSQCLAVPTSSVSTPRPSRTFSVGLRECRGSTAYHRRAAEACARIKHFVTCRSQDRMQLFSFVPPPGLAHLPTQFAALFSHRGASITAAAGKLWSTPMPKKVIAKKR